MCLPPLVWQTYDIQFTAPRWASDGSKIRDAHVTAWVNGTKVQDNVALPNKTGAGAEEAPTLLPIRLQDHRDPVRYRNVWIIDRGLATGNFPIYPTPDQIIEDAKAEEAKAAEAKLEAAKLEAAAEAEVVRVEQAKVEQAKAEQASKSAAAAEEQQVEEQQAEEQQVEEQQVEEQQVEEQQVEEQQAEEQQAEEQQATDTQPQSPESAAQSELPAAESEDQ